MNYWDISSLMKWTISVFGLIGNGITFCTFGKLYNQNASTFLLRALALVDSFLLITWSLQTLARRLFPFSSFWDLAIFFYIIRPFDEISQTAALWTILLVGVHRYIAVCKPLMASRLCTLGNARRHLFGMLLFTFIANLPIFFRFWITEVRVPLNNTDYNTTHRTVFTNMGKSDWFNNIYSIAFRTVILNYVIPVGSLIFITARLLQSLRASRQRRNELMGSQRRRGEADSRSECMVFVVLVVFLLCHTVLPVCLVLDMLDTLEETGTSYYRNVYYYLYDISHHLVLLNSSVNIIIYVVFSRNFRRTLCPCLRSARSRRNSQQLTTLTYST